MDAYRRESAEDELDLLARYAWNMALGGSLYGPLQALEVALRNTLHDALTTFHQTDRWYQHRSVFPAGVAGDKTFADAKAAVNTISRHHNPATADGPGRVVAELSFGFWTTLLTGSYGSPASRRTGWRPLWPALVTVAFPNLPNPAGTARDRVLLAQRFDDIRKLRNRVSHHEPVWKGLYDPKAKVRLGVDIQHDQLLETIGWINPALAKAVATLETLPGGFPQVFRHAEAPFRSLLATLP
jgi:hypothetical protein